MQKKRVQRNTKTQILYYKKRHVIDPCRKTAPKIFSTVRFQSLIHSPHLFSFASLPNLDLFISSFHNNLISLKIKKRKETKKHISLKKSKSHHLPLPLISLSKSMDPSLPPPFTAFPPFTNSNSFSPPQHPFYGAAVNSSAVSPPNNNQFFQPSPPVPVHPSVNHPPYSEVSSVTEKFNILT